MEMLNDQFQSAEFDTTTGILSQAWNKNSKNMLDSNYKEEILKIMELIDILVPKGLKYVLSDTKYFRFVITPDTQIWVAKTIRKKFLEHRIKKFALVMSDELFSKVSVDQAVHEAIPDNVHHTRYFDQKSLALEWLINH